MSGRFGETGTENPSLFYFRWFQRGMYAAAMKLRDLPDHTKIGSWNARILGYFSVTNLDGFANSSIEDYAKKYRLDEYIEDKRLWPNFAWT